MSTTADATLLPAGAQIRRGVTAFAARARVERLGELSLNQTSVLGLLSRISLLTPGEIAARLHLQPQSLTRTFAALEESGALRRLPDPGDGRQSLLTITDAGRVLLRDEMRPRDVWVATTIASELTDTEREVLVLAARLLERLADYQPPIAEVAPA